MRNVCAFAYIFSVPELLWCGVLGIVRDVSRERRVERAAIDEAGLRAAIEIADELMATSGKTMDAEKKARLIVAIYRLNATTEEGLDRAMLMNLLTAIA